MSCDAPPGWYPDPEDGRQLRFWDGGRWTPNTKFAGLVDTAPVVPAPDPYAGNAPWPEATAPEPPPGSAGAPSEYDRTSSTQGIDPRTDWVLQTAPPRPGGYSSFSPPAGYWNAFPVAPQAPERKSWWRRYALILAVLALACIAGSVALFVVATGSGPKTPANLYPPDGGVTVTDTSGHFTARFPSQPSEVTGPSSTVGTAKITIHIAATRSPEPIFVEAADVTPPIPAGQEDVTLRGAIGGFEGSSGLTLHAQSSTTFMGYIARQADFTEPDGTPFTVLFFLDGNARLYGLAAPAGATFSTLAASFTALP